MNKKVNQEQNNELESIGTASVLLAIKHALRNRIGANAVITSENSLLLSFDGGERFELKIEKKHSGIL